jgi:hypothetical protein
MNTPENSTEASAPAPPPVRRLNFVLSERAYQDLHSLAVRSHRSMTELLRFGIGLMKLAVEEQEAGHRLMVVDKKNKGIKQIVIPD